MSRILSLAYCVLFVVGCGQAEPSSNDASRFVTTVTWDANCQPVIATQAVHPDSIGVDPHCGGNDLLLSDKPLITGSGGGGGTGGGGVSAIIDPTSNALCLANPFDTESVSLKTFPYAGGAGQTWAHHVVAYIASSQSGGLYNDGQDAGIAAFDYHFAVNQYATVPAAVQNANGVEFDAPGGATECSSGQYQCVGAVLQHCDGSAQWQNSVNCAASGLACDAATGSCTCAPPVCGSSCGTLTSACGASVDCGGCQGYAQRCVANECRTTCHCAKGFVCDPDGACIHL